MYVLPFLWSWKGYSIQRSERNQIFSVSFCPPSSLACLRFPYACFGCHPQLTPEEEEKRRVRRERNKLAAAKCRNRRRELTEMLQGVSREASKREPAKRLHQNSAHSIGRWDTHKGSKIKKIDDDMMYMKRNHCRFYKKEKKDERFYFNTKYDLKTILNSIRVCVCLYLLCIYFDS